MNCDVLGDGKRPVVIPYQTSDLPVSARHEAGLYQSGDSFLSNKVIWRTRYSVLTQAPFRVR